MLLDHKARQIGLASLLTILLTSLLSTPLRAESVELYVIGESMECSEQMCISIPYGKMAGLAIGQELPIYGAYSSFAEAPEDMRTGVGIIESIQDHQATLSVMYDGPAAGSYPADGVDIVGFDAQIEHFDNLFFELGRNSIGLLDVEGLPLLDNYMTMSFQAERMQEKWLGDLASEVRYVGEAVKSEVEGIDIEEGMFAGKNLYEVMIGAEASHVQAFLEYVTVRPKKYRGADWKISEVFATWAVSGAPIPLDNLKASFLSAAEDEATFDRLIGQYTAEALNDLVQDLLREADDLGEEGKFHSGQRLASLGLRIAEAKGIPSQVAWAHFTMGQLEENREAYTKAADAFGRSADAFLAYEEDLGASFAMNNQGSNALKAGDLEQAESVLRLALKIQREHMEDPDKSELMRAAVGLTLRNNGDCQKAIGKTRKAIKFYEEALETLEGVEGLTAVGRRAGTYERLAEVYTDMKKDKKAAEYADLYDKELNVLVDLVVSDEDE